MTGESGQFFWIPAGMLAGYETCAILVCPVVNCKLAQVEKVKDEQNEVLTGSVSLLHCEGNKPQWPKRAYS